MLRSITFEQFNELRAAEQLEPFAAQRADMHAQMVLAGLSNVLFAVSHAKNRLKWSDFTLPFRKVKVQPVVAKTKSQLFALAKMCIGIYENVKPS